jgi:hypothetical protein
MRKMERRQHQFDRRLWARAALMAALLRNYDRLPAGLGPDLPLKRVWVSVGSVD